MRLLSCVAAAALGAPLLAIAAAAGPTNPSLCQQLAAEAWHSSDALWKPQGLRTLDGLKTLSIVPVKEDDTPEPDPRETAASALLLQRMEARGALTEGGPNSAPQVEHLPGTQVYMGSVSGGTALCQISMFAEVGPGVSAHLRAEPQGYTAPCYNVQGTVGTVFGRPAYIEMGTVSDTSDDKLIRLTPWMGTDWGRACQVTIELNYQLQLKNQFCGDQAVCPA
jgi:hypothetical protein